MMMLARGTHVRHGQTGKIVEVVWPERVAIVWDGVVRALPDMVLLAN